MRSLLSIEASNFLSLGEVNVRLQDLTVLVGPNGAGKSNLLKVIQFLGDTARLDLLPALSDHGGFDRLLFRGSNNSKAQASRIRLGITGLVTGNSSEAAPDEYVLSIWRHRFGKGNAISVIQRYEDFVFKRTKGAGRRITVRGNKVELVVQSARTPEVSSKEVELSSTSSGLSTLRRLKNTGADQINQLAELFATFRVFEIDAFKARQPSRYDADIVPTLKSDAANVASFLMWLREKHSDVFDLLEEDLGVIVPSIKKIHLTRVAGTDDSSFVVQFEEKGLSGLTSMGEASFGTVRALALLAMLHDPHPPRLTCVEEIDHGLHPHALDRIVERMRSASRRTQLLVVTHSPALANRLEPHELVVCEKDEFGRSIIPAVRSETVAQMAAASGLLPGELWFSGALGGGLS
jgi:predicted ATPase